MKTTIAVVALALLTGCDDVVSYDVGPGGAVIAAVDANGKTELLGDGKRPRDLVVVDATTGEQKKLTRKPLKLACPRALPGGGAVAVEERKRLVVIDADGTVRPVLEAAGKNALFLPAVSPDGALAAVVEASKWGERGVLHLVDLATGTDRAKVESLLPGATWVGNDLVAARAATELRLAIEDDKPAPTKLPEKVEGDLVRVSETGEVRSLVRTTLAAIVPIYPLGKRALVALPNAAGDGLALSLLDPGEGHLSALALGKGSTSFAALSPDGKRVLFTRSREGDATLEGELLLAPVDDLAKATLVPTPGVVSAPRFATDDRIVFFAGDALIAQGLRGEERLTLARSPAGESRGGK